MLRASASPNRIAWVIAPAALLLLSCDTMEPITEPFVLAGGTEVTVAQLENGREKYMLYCRACHGENGDGRGPAGIGLRPPPRNFKEVVFKFGGVAAGELPPDSELKRIILQGLEGTAMLPWEIPESDLDDVIQYIKTFAVDEDGANIWTEDEVGELIEIPEDPWAGKEKEGIARGKSVYHGLAQCSKCHPAYASNQEIWDATKAATGSGSMGAFRKNMYFPEAKFAEAYGHKLLPPDFTRHPIKAGATPKDLYRTIASGIGGTAMPMWKGSIPDDDIYAIAHFVADLYKRNLTDSNTARDAWLKQPVFEPPEPVVADGEEAEGDDDDDDEEDAEEQ